MAQYSKEMILIRQNIKIGSEGSIMEKIVITTTSFGKYDKMPLKLLEDNGFEVALNPYERKLKKDEIVQLCKDAVGIIAGTEMLDGEVIKKLTNLKVISRCGIGLENVDLNTAKKAGIKVFNTPDAPMLAVAELTIGLILNLLRKINQMDIAVKKGKWEKLMGNLLHGKKVGIIGFGRIGKRVAELLKLFGCEIVYADPFVDDGLMGLRRLSLKELLCWADIISIHVSSKDRLLGKKEFQLMKKGTWLINVSRGEVIDEKTLFQALEKRQLSGAAIDVFEEEPYTGSLQKLDNVILTPHIGSYAEEARIQMEMQAAQNLLKGLEGLK